MLGVVFLGRSFSKYCSDNHDVILQHIPQSVRDTWRLHVRLDLDLHLSKHNKS